MMETWMFSTAAEIPVEWSACLERFPADRCDVYYHPAYCSTWLEWEQGTAVALHASIEGIDFLYCFLMKELPVVFDSHWRYDAQSFYGYGGIVSSAPPTPAQLERFNDAIDRWMCDYGIVAEFVRHHPLLHATPAVARRADYVRVRTNVYARLQRKVFLDAATRRNVTKAQRSGVRIEQLDATAGAAIFSALYQQTAARLRMESFYHFPRRYFDCNAQRLADYAFYRIAYLDDCPIAGQMILRWGTTLTYHLGASDEQYWYCRPNDLLFATLLEEAAAGGYATVNLGGGTTTDPQDSLYRYKSKFGNEHMPVFVGWRVHHRPTYEQLCSQWEQHNPDRAKRYRGYFLRYRIGEFERRVMIQ